jgi:hypothetical protein
MKYAHRPAVDSASEIAATRDLASSHKNAFAHLVDALHESRRLQAARLIHHYRYLVQQNRESETRTATPERKIAKGNFANADQH